MIRQAMLSMLVLGAAGLAPIRIGTRGSPLALAQAYLTRELLIANFPEACCGVAFDVDATFDTVRTGARPGGRDPALRAAVWRRVLDVR